MDSENRIINRIEELMPQITEDLLISISNKGTVNRGKKDLEKVREQILLEESTEGEICAVIGKETRVVLSKSLPECSCSCPAMGICRHIITALFYCKELDNSLNHTKEDVTQQPAQKVYTKDDFVELNALDEETIKKMAGKKTYNSYLMAIRKKNDAVFEYGDMLKVTINSQNAVLFFPAKDSVKGAMCSCKDKGLCSHKIYALTAYQIGELGKELALEEENIQISDEGRQFLNQIKEKMAAYMEKGMASLTDDVIKECERNYIRAYGMKLFLVAEECKLLSSYFAFYFEKNVSYSNARTMHLICKIYNRADSMLAVKEPSALQVLVGKKREESCHFDELNLIGLGAAAGLTKRKDLIVSAYFYSPDLKEMLVLSTMRPNNERGDQLLSYLYHTGLIWSEELPIDRLSTAKLILKDASITSGRLSGTKRTLCKIGRETASEDLEKIAFKDYTVLREELRKHIYQYYAPFSLTESIYLITVQKQGEAVYNQIRQSVVFSVYDEEGQEICFEIRYQDVTKRAIEWIENKTKCPQFSYLLGSFREHNGILWASYLGGMAEGHIVNLYF